jgi:hypothetical protein
VRFRGEAIVADRDLRLSRAQRWAVVGVALAVGCLLAYGVAGSYTSVTHLASVHGVPLPRLVPVGIDGGLAGTVLLDIVLTWTGFAVWWLRWLARVLTVGMIAANGAAGWPDPGRDRASPGRPGDDPRRDRGRPVGTAPPAASWGEPASAHPACPVDSRTVADLETVAPDGAVGGHLLPGRHRH